MKNFKTTLLALSTFALSTSALAGWGSKIQISPVAPLTGGNWGSVKISAAQTKFNFDACSYRLKVGNRYVMLSNFEVNSLFTQLNFSETSAAFGSTLHREYNVMVSPSSNSAPQASVYVISKGLLGAGAGKDIPISENAVLLQENCPQSSGAALGY